MSKMITAVVMVDGRCRLMKLHELSTDVDFWISSATSFVGVGGGREDLHMLDVWQVECQWSRQERGGGGDSWFAPCCVTPQHSCKLNLNFAWFLTFGGDFFRQEFG